ncbi:carbon storage regulator [compost metagenome]
MPLILGRKSGQKIVITIDPAADPQELLRALQVDGIEITVKDISDHGTQVRLMVDAPRELLVLREELVKDGGDQNVENENDASCEPFCR